MALKTFLINSNQALYSDYEFSIIQSALMSPGVFNFYGNAEDFKVTEKAGGANMSVDVSPGGALVEFLRGGINFSVTAANNAVVNLLISPNGGGSDRVDAIILKLKQDEPNSLKNNVAELDVVLGTGATPLSDNDIDIDVGDTNWMRLADVYVGPGAVSILDGDIEDTRTPIAIGKDDGVYRTTFKGDASQMFGVLLNPFSETLLPSVDATYDIGSALLRINEIHAVSFYGNGSNLTNVITDGLIIPVTMGENLYDIQHPIVAYDGGLSAEFNVYSVRYAAEVFTLPADTNKIYRFDWAMGRLGALTSGTTITVELRKTSGGNPDLSAPALLATQTMRVDYIGGTDVGSNAVWLRWYLNSPIPVTGGDVLCLVLKYTSGGVGTYIKAVSTGGAFDAGNQGLTTDNGGATWSPISDHFNVRVFGNRQDSIPPIYIESNPRAELRYYPVYSGAGNPTGIYTVNRAGVSFVVNEITKLTKFRIFLDKLGAPANVAVFVEIYATDAVGKPTGVALFSNSTLMTNTITLAGSFFEYTPNLIVVPGTRYAITVAVPAAGDVANNIRIRSVTGSPRHPMSARIISTDGGVSWGNLAPTEAVAFWYSGVNESRTPGKAYGYQSWHPDRLAVVGYPDSVSVNVLEDEILNLRPEGAKVTGFSGLIPGKFYLISPNGADPIEDTGSYSSMSDTWERYGAGAQVGIGRAISSDTIFVDFGKDIPIGSFSDSGQDTTASTNIFVPRIAKKFTVQLVPPGGTSLVQGIASIRGSQPAFYSGAGVYASFGIGESDYGVAFGSAGTRGETSVRAYR